jgi:hypothetical protein
MSSKRSKSTDRWHINLEELGALRRQMVRHLHVTAMLTVPRDQNVIVGERAICAYLQLRSATTLQRLIESHAFPAVPTSDGSLMSTCTMIDEWMWIQSQLKQRNKPLTRREEQRLRKVDAIRRDLGMETWGEIRKKKGAAEATPQSTRQTSLSRGSSRASRSRAVAATVEGSVEGSRTDRAATDPELHGSVPLGLPGDDIIAPTVKPVGRQSGGSDCNGNQSSQDSDTHSFLRGVTLTRHNPSSITEPVTGATDDNSTHQAAVHEQGRTEPLWGRTCPYPSVAGHGPPPSDQDSSPRRPADRPPRGSSHIERARSLFAMHGKAVEDGG